MKECPICYTSKQRVFITLQCEHTLCRECWGKWKNTQLKYDIVCPTCPMCRTPQKPYSIDWGLVLWGLVLWWIWTLKTPANSEEIVQTV